MRPWTINKTRTIVYGKPHFCCEIRSSEGDIITWTNDPMKELYFERIVRCSNLHESLLIGCKLSLNRLLVVDGSANQPTNALQNSLIKVIASAEKI